MKNAFEKKVSQFFFKKKLDIDRGSLNNYLNQGSDFVKAFSQKYWVSL
jgi:hypothetical protein